MSTDHLQSEAGEAAVDSRSNGRKTGQKKEFQQMEIERICKKKNKPKFRKKKRIDL